MTNDEILQAAIKNRFSGAPLCEFDVETIKHAAEKGKLNLRGADLNGEKLTKTPVVITGLDYWCMITDGYMYLGCKRFTHDEWANFNDEKIKKMDYDALEFWRQWKIPLLAICAAHAIKSGE